MTNTYRWHYRINPKDSVARCGQPDGPGNGSGGLRHMSRTAYHFAKAIANGDDMCGACLTLYRADLDASPESRRTLELVEQGASTADIIAAQQRAAEARAAAYHARINDPGNDADNTTTNTPGRSTR